MTRIIYSDVSVLEDSILYNKAFSLLPRFRQQKAQRLLRMEDRLLSVGVWIVLKETLGQSGFDCNKLSFETSKNGAVCVKDSLGADIHTSLSHSGNIVLAAVSDSPVGADVQKCTDFSFDIMQKFYTAREREAVTSAVNDYEKKNLFFRIWTLKESYVKLTGKGIAGFGECEMLPQKNVFITGGAQKLKFEEFEIPNYKAAVCMSFENKYVLQKTDIAAILKNPSV